MSVFGPKFSVIVRPQNMVKLTGAIAQDDGTREILVLDFSQVEFLDECSKKQMDTDSKEQREKAGRLPEQFTRLKMADNSILVTESIPEIFRKAGLELKD